MKNVYPLLLVLVSTLLCFSLQGQIESRFSIGAKGQISYLNTDIQDAYSDTYIQYGASATGRVWLLKVEGHALLGNFDEQDGSQFSIGEDIIQYGFNAGFSTDPEWLSYFMWDTPWSVHVLYGQANSTGKFRTQGQQANLTEVRTVGSQAITTGIAISPDWGEIELNGEYRWYKSDLLDGIPDGLSPDFSWGVNLSVRVVLIR